jgi:replicative DNA helicase
MTLAIENEKALLGSLIIRPDDWYDIGDKLVPDDFSVPFHRQVYAAIAEILSSGAPLDIVTLSDFLQKGPDQENVLVAVGALAQCAGYSRASTLHYASIAQQASQDKALIAFAQGVLKSVAEKQEGRFEQAQMAISQLNQKNVEKIPVLSEILPTVIEQIDEQSRSEQECSGLSTGFIDLDKMTSGLKPGNMVVLAARPSMGKAQPLDANILTSDGFVKMGSLKIGDKIIGSNGENTEIIGIFPQGVQPVYKVSFTDGTSTECTTDHLWLTQTRNERRRGCSGSIKTLQEIIDTIKRPDNLSPNHAVPCVLPVIFAKKGQLNLHPYLMGLLLGDGGFSHPSSIYFSNPELDLQSKLIELLPPEDAVSKTDYGLTLRLRRKKRNNKVPITRDILRSYGLFGLKSHEKFIPVDYLFSSVDDRLELLRGLIDTDGHVTESGRLIEFTSSSSQLAKDFIFLVRSLGGVAREKNKNHPGYSHNGQKRIGKPSVRIYASFPASIIPVASQKNINKWLTKKNPKQNHKSIEKIEFVRNKECQCIKVDACDSLYVTDDFILTHNTLLAMNIAENVALKARLPVVVFSLEMSKEELCKRTLASLGKINFSSILSGKMKSPEYVRLSSVLEKSYGAKFFIEDKPALSLPEMRAKLCRIKREHGLALAVVDYLTLMKSPEGENETRKIGALSRGIKQIARELEIPILVISQLNRAVEARPNKRPNMSDLRASGEIEQDADVIMFIYRDEVYDEHTQDKGIAEIKIAKQRNGVTGTIKLAFQGEYCRFENFIESEHRVVPISRQIKNYKNIRPTYE